MLTFEVLAWVGFEPTRGFRPTALKAVPFGQTRCIMLIVESGLLIAGSKAIFLRKPSTRFRVLHPLCKRGRESNPHPVIKSDWDSIAVSFLIGYWIHYYCAENAHLILLLFESSCLDLLTSPQCSPRGSNPGPWAHKTHALPTELEEPRHYYLLVYTLIRCLVFKPLYYNIYKFLLIYL